MDSKNSLFRLPVSLLGSVLGFPMLTAHSLSAATVWNGPLITYSQPAPDPTQPANQDRITDKVWLTRALTSGMFNAKTESAYAHLISPADTEWAVGSLEDFASLTYVSWETAGAGKPVLNLVGTQLVLHLISDDIYLSLKFTQLGGHGVGAFTYERSTPLSAPPAPAANITNPVEGAVFAAAASITISAAASVSNGSVTNVAFFGNGASLGSAQVSPFSIIASNLAAGDYALTAVATSMGISSTSAVVNFHVVVPVEVKLLAQSIANNRYTFDYTANAGLTYLVQSSSNLVDWMPLVTNVASGSLVQFTDDFMSGGSRFYRVGLIQNP